MRIKEVRKKVVELKWGGVVREGVGGWNGTQYIIYLCEY